MSAFWHVVECVWKEQLTASLCFATSLEQGAQMEDGHRVSERN